RFATRWPRRRAAKATSQRLRSSAAVGHTHATLFGSAQSRQVQFADLVRTGADHRIPDLSGRGGQAATRFSLLRTGAGGAVVWDFGGLARNYSRAPGVYARAHG